MLHYNNWLEYAAFQDFKMQRAVPQSVLQSACNILTITSSDLSNPQQWQHLKTTSLEISNFVEDGQMQMIKSCCNLEWFWYKHKLLRAIKFCKYKLQSYSTLKKMVLIVPQKHNVEHK